jgi:hypothetical protein
MLRRARIAGVLLALAVTAAPTLASGSNAGDAEIARLIELDAEVGRAIVAGDWETLDRL